MIRVVSVVLALVWGEAVYAQAPAAPVVQPRVYANMLQLMRGTLYPQSNVIFTAQVEDPAAFKPAAHQSTSSDPFTSAYGGWEAVENSGMAMAETANLLLVPRQCSNGKPAPVQNADWKMWIMMATGRLNAELTRLNIPVNGQKLPVTPA